MEQFNDLLGSIAWRLRQGLGLEPSDQRQLAAWKAKYAQDKADNQDRLESIKDEVRQLEARILQNKAKFEQSHGPVQRIIGAEIEQSFRELDRKERQVKIIVDGIEALSIALDKIKELEHAKAHGLKEGELDQVSVLTEDAIAENKQVLEALKELQELEHGGLETEPVDVQERLRQMASASQSDTGLSEKSLKRLKQLQKQTEG